MRPLKCACGFDKWPLVAGFDMCRRCDTVAHTIGHRAGPPNTPGSRDGVLPALFGDRP